MEHGCNFDRIFGDSGRIVGFYGFFDFAGEFCNFGYKSEFFRSGEVIKGDILFEFGAFFSKSAENGADSCVSVLNVINGVIVGVLYCKAKVEEKVGVGFAHIEEETCCVDRNFVEKVGKGDCFTGTFAHFFGFAVTHKFNHLHENNVELASVKADCIHCALKSCDVAVVVCTPDIDYFIESAFREFVVMVSDVACKIGGVSVCADDYVVFKFKSFDLFIGFAFFFETFGKNFCVFVPESAVFFIGKTFFGKDLYNFFDGAVVIKAAFAEPYVIVDAVFSEVALKSFYVCGKSICNKSCFSFGGFCVNVFVAVDFGEFFCADFDIFAVVTVFGEFDCVFAEMELEISCFKGFSEFFDLVACVVDIEFAGNVIAAPFHCFGKAVADCAAPCVAHMHRAGGVCGNKFDHNFFAFAHVAGSVSIFFGENGGNGFCEPMGCIENVKEAGACYFCFFKISSVKVDMSDDCVRDLARAFTESFCGNHCYVGSKVAVFVVCRNFNVEFRNFTFRKFACGDCFVHRFFDKFFVLRFGLGH